MKRVGLAVVGYGRFGRVHARRAQAHGAFDVACVVDPDPHARESAVADGFYAVADVAQIPHGIEAAAIVTPAATHAALAITLLYKGIDVLVEKPFATSEADIDAMLQATHATGRTLCTAHIERFNMAVATPPWEAPPKHIEFRRRSRWPGGGAVVVLDLMIHDLDLASHLLAFPTDLAVEVVDVQTHKLGITAHVVMGSTSLVFHASHGADTSAACMSWGDHGRFFELPLVHSTEHGHTDALTRQYTAFLHRMRGHRSPIASALDGATAARRALSITARL